MWLAETIHHIWSLRKTEIFLIYIQQDAALHSLFCLETALHASGDSITHRQERK